MNHTWDEAVDSTPAWRTLALSVVWITLSKLATDECRQETIEARWTFICVYTWFQWTFEFCCCRGEPGGTCANDLELGKSPAELLHD